MTTRDYSAYPTYLLIYYPFKPYPKEHDCLVISQDIGLKLLAVVIKLSHGIVVINLFLIPKCFRSAANYYGP